MVAAGMGRIEIMKYLISVGADIHKTDKCGCTCLHFAVLNYELDIVQYLVSIGADIHHTDERKRTSLHIAALLDNIEVAQYLISVGADIDKGDNLGNTPLHNAAQREHMYLVQYLISVGANINKTTNDGNKPIDIANNGNIRALLSNPEEIQKLRTQYQQQQQANNKTLIEAAGEGDLVGIKKYMSYRYGADVNYSSYEGG